MTEDEVVLEVPADDGGIVALRKADISWITDANLKANKILMTREEVLRCWKEAVEELRHVPSADREHAFVDREFGGEWEVFTMHYSPETDPLLNEPKGKG